MTRRLLTLEQEAEFAALYATTPLRELGARYGITDQQAAKLGHRLGLSKYRPRAKTVMKAEIVQRRVEREQAVARTIGSGSLTLAALCRKLGISQATGRYVLRRLRGEGVVYPEGASTQTRWRLTNPPRSTFPLDAAWQRVVPRGRPGNPGEAYDRQA